MDGIYGLYPTMNDYADKALMSPDNLMLPAEYQGFLSPSPSGGGYHHHMTPMFGSDELISAASATISQVQRNDEDYDDVTSAIKAKITSHPRYSKLLEAYVDCQKVGAPPEIACLLDEIRRENDICRPDSLPSCLGADPELDEFMETFCEILVKFKSDLSRPFGEAFAFLNKIEMQLGNLCKGLSIYLTKRTGNNGAR